jgi:hypothetical protein
LFDSPLLVSVWIAVVLVAISLGWTFSALRRADEVAARAEAVLARMCADEAARKWLAAGDAGSSAPFALGCGATCTVVPDARRQRLDVSVSLPSSAECRFRCELLPGGAPAAFALPFATAAGRSLPPGMPEPVQLPVEAMPVLQVDKRPWSPAQNAAFARDAALALLRLPTGTDRDDFVLGAGVDQLQLLAPRDGLLVFDGNLWLDAGDPLTIELNQDLTVVVRGNLYLGRSLRIEGSGHLLLAVQAAPGLPFADRDGNGRWSAGDELLVDGEFRGPMEGSGAVWLGLPGRAPDELVIDAGVEVSGELQLLANASVRGPLLLHHGVTVLRTGAVLRATGERLPQVGRCRVPGYRPEGRPRPGLPVERRDA